MIGRRELDAAGPEFSQYVQAGDLIVDEIHTADYPDYTIGLDTSYRNLLAELKPGVSVLLIHTALDGAESAGMAGGVEAWGNRWRQQDYNFFTSDDFLNILNAENIQLTTWREVNKKWKER